MAKYKLLKGIAAGLANTFISRNNDIDGFWGLGVIYSEVNELGYDKVIFSLLDNSASIEVKCSSVVTKGYREIAERMLTHAGFVLEEVTTIQIELHFNQKYEATLHHPPLTWGDPFSCCVKITDIYNREREFTNYGWCGLHDSSKERRSIRRLPYAYF